MAMARKESAIQLTLTHEWMTVPDAELLMQDAYERYRPYKKYHGWKNVETLLGIAFGIFLRSTQEEMEARIEKIKEKSSRQSGTRGVDF